MPYIHWSQASCMGREGPRSAIREMSEEGLVKSLLYEMR